MAETSPIPHIVETQLLPRFIGNAKAPLTVARARREQMADVAELTLAPRRLQGPRQAVRAFTFGGLTARWPNDKLIETQAPLLLFVLKGVAELCCGDYILHAAEGQAVFVPAGVPRWSGSKTLEHLEENSDRFCDNILFSERCGSLEIWLNYDRGNRHLRSAPNEVLMVRNVRLIRLLEEMQEEAVAQRTHAGEINRRLLEVFLLALHRDLQEGKAIQPGRLTTREGAARRAQAPIARAQQYVREHLHESLTQETMARLVRLSRTQFIRRFREETGQTFNQFVTQCRIEQAGVLLRQTDFPLTYIHQAVGYQSAAHFNVVFRKHTGVSPAAFRAQKKETDTVGA